MKSNKGITLTSLVIYVTGLIMVIELMSLFTGYFYKSLDEITLQQNSQEQYSKFLSYITKDVNSNNLLFVQSGINGTDCIIFKFEDGTQHQYIYQDCNIYYLEINSEVEKKITLCSDVIITSGIDVFSYSDKKIYINFNIGNESFSTSLSTGV